MESSSGCTLSNKGKASYPPLLIMSPQSSIIFLLLMVRMRHERPTSQPAPSGKIDTFCINKIQIIKMILQIRFIDLNGIKIIESKFTLVQLIENTTIIFLLGYYSEL